MAKQEIRKIKEKPELAADTADGFHVCQWFLRMVQGDGEPDMSRMYIHKEA